MKDLRIFGRCLVLFLFIPTGVLVRFHQIPFFSIEIVGLQEQRRVTLEEKIRVLQAGRDEAQGHVSHQVNLVADLQTRNSQLAIDNETMKRKIVDLQQVCLAH